MQTTTTEAKKHQRFQETSKFLPVFFVISNISILYFIYIFLHCIPLLQNAASHHRAVVETVIFNCVTFLLLVCYLKCILVHPGTIPDIREDASWEYLPTIKEASLDVAGLQEMKRSGDRRHCKWCNKYKPDRCHHCRVCRICILRMDHHCPWIYNCVGFRNHKYFFLLLFYSTIDCHIIVWTMMESLRNSVGGNTVFIKMFFLLFGETLAACIGLLVTAFFFFHVWLLLKAMTTIEFCEKQMKNKSYDSSVYDRGLCGNLQAAMGDNRLFWLCPWAPPSGKGLYFLTEDIALHKDDEAPHGMRRKGAAKVRYGATAGKQKGKKSKKSTGTGSAGEDSEEDHATSASSDAKGA